MLATAHQRHVQLKNIALLTDLGADAEKPLRYAASFAQWYDSRLMVAHASPPDPYAYLSHEPVPSWPAPAREAAKQKMKSMTAQADLRELMAEIVIRESNIAGLLQQLEDRDPDLLILATHARNGVGKWLNGSVTEEVFRRVHWPVLVLGPHCLETRTAYTGVHKILYATDLSALSLQALHYAFGIAQDHEAELTILHVEADPGQGFSLDHAMVLRKLEDWLQSPAQEALEKANCIVNFGDPGQKILETAIELRADMIVMGACGFGATSRAASHFVGGTAYEVASSSYCPVLIVPHPCLH